MRLILFLALATLAVQGLADELLVSNYGGNNVARFDTATKGFLGILAGGTISGPLATRVGPDGLLYVCSEKNNQVLRYNLTTHAYLDTFAAANLNSPTAITFDHSGDALVANFADSTVSLFDKHGVFQRTLVTSGEGGLNGPDVGSVIGPDGTLYLPSFYTNQILRYDASSGAFLGQFNAAGTGLSQPRTILWRDNLVWVTSDNGNKVLRYKPDGTLNDVFVKPGSGSLLGASGMAFGSDGYLYVSSWRNNRVNRYKLTDGTFVDSITSNLNQPTYLTIVPEPPTNAAILLAGLAQVARRLRFGRSL